MRKVPGQDQRAGIRVVLDERAPRERAPAPGRSRSGSTTAGSATCTVRCMRSPEKHGAAGRRGEAHAHVTRRVADPRLEAKVLADLEVALDEQRLARPRPPARRCRRCIPSPPLPDSFSYFQNSHSAPAMTYLRVREGRDPAAVLPARVPADVVDVQVGAHDEVHLLGRHADRGEIVEIASRSACSRRAPGSAPCRCRHRCRSGWCGRGVRTT